MDRLLTSLALSRAPTVSKWNSMPGKSTYFRKCAFFPRRIFTSQKLTIAACELCVCTLYTFRVLIFVTSNKWRSRIIENYLSHGIVSLLFNVQCSMMVSMSTELLSIMSLQKDQIMISNCVPVRLHDVSYLFGNWIRFHGKHMRRRSAHFSEQCEFCFNDCRNWSYYIDCVFLPNYRII